MSVTTELLKAEHVGIRDLRTHLSSFLKINKPVVVTDRGTPSKVLLSYSDMLELTDILDELQDRETIKAVQDGRMAIANGAKGIPVENLFKRIRLQEK